MPETPANGAPQIVLAFDFGLRRIGVACGDTVSRTAAPLEAVPVKFGVPRWERIAALLRHGSATNPTIPDFHLAFVMIGLVALVSVLDFLKLDTAAGAVVSGHAK